MIDTRRAVGSRPSQLLYPIAFNQPLEENSLIIILRDSGVYFSCFGALMGHVDAATVKIGGPWTFAGADLGARGSLGGPCPPTPKRFNYAIAYIFC